jgi:tRNA (cmo5U34)-methyltransferase
VSNDKVDKVVPGDKWEFDESVAKVFDDMLARSIPSYETMRALTFQLMHNHHKARGKNGWHLLDLGASRGEALRPFIETEQYKCDALEVSQPMIDEMMKLYSGNRNVTIRNGDMREQEFLAKNFGNVQYTGILSVLTIQFTPIEYRLDILQQVYDHLTDGGMFIFIEKVIGGTSQLNRLMVDSYYEMKSGNGYTEEDIKRKRLSLEGVLVPQTARANEEMLSLTGFRKIDCFYRHLNFAGWVCIK